MPDPSANRMLFCLPIIIFSSCVQEPQSGTTSTPDAFGREWTAAWDSRDVDRILTFYTEDALFDDVPSVDNGWDKLLHGHQPMRESLARTFDEMPDLGFGFVSASSSEDRMVIEWIMTGTRYLDFTGRFSTRGVSVIELKGGKIASEHDYYDTYHFLSQLGMVSAIGEAQPGARRDSASQ